MSTREYPFVPTLAATLIVQACPDALAQEQKAGSGSLLDEVVVTARKAEESAQTVPITMTPLTPDDLTKSVVLNVQDLETRVTGLVVTPDTKGGAPNFSIRVAKTGGPTSECRERDQDASGCTENPRGTEAAIGAGRLRVNNTSDGTRRWEISVRRHRAAHKSRHVGRSIIGHAMTSPLLDDEVLAPVRFVDLMSDPVTTVRKIDSRWNLAFSEESGPRMAAWVSDPASRSDRYANLPYSLDNFGTSIAEINSSFARHGQHLSSSQPDR